MKETLIIFLLFYCAAAFGQDRTVWINKYPFDFKNIAETTDYTDDPIQKVEVYKNNKKLLTHTISNVGGDCNSEDVELGKYEITDSTIVFYSYWARAGDAPVSPFGVRRQVYLIKTNGNLILKDAEIYIETSRKGWEENKGIEYLFSKPKSEMQRTQLLEYIRQAEKKYGASFVFGLKADWLFKIVKEKLKIQIQATTKHWKTIYSTSAFGYKM